MWTEYNWRDTSHPRATFVKHSKNVRRRDLPELWGYLRERLSWADDCKRSFA